MKQPIRRTVTVFTIPTMYATPNGDTPGAEVWAVFGSDSDPIYLTDLLEDGTEVDPGLKIAPITDPDAARAVWDKMGLGFLSLELDFPSLGGTP